MTLPNNLDACEALYQVEILSIKFIFRPLTRKEFDSLWKIVEDLFDLEEEVCKLCTLSPEGYDFENCPAGVPGILANYILQVSGFGNPEFSKRLLAAMQEDINNSIEKQMDTIIVSTFPQYTFEDVYNWSQAKTFDIYSRAVWLLQLTRGLAIQHQDNNLPKSQVPAKSSGGQASAGQIQGLPRKKF